MAHDPDEEIVDFIRTYLRQLAETGMPAEEPVPDAPVYRVEPGAEGVYVVIRDEPDGGASEQEGWFGDRQSAFLAAAMLTAVASEPRGPGPDLSDDAFEDGGFAGPAHKALIARAFRGLIRNPAAIELFLEAVGDKNVLEEAYATALEHIQEGQEN